MKKIPWQIIGLLLIIFVLAACGGGATAPAEEAAAPAAEEAAPVEEEAAPAEEESAPAEEEAAPAEEETPIKLGLVLSGPRDDNSWNEAAYNAMKAMEAEGVEITFSEQTPNPDTGRVMREMIDSGANVIMGHAYLHQDPMFELAEEFPDLAFVWSGGDNRFGPNISDLDQLFYQPAYLVGILAGHMSETGKLGILHGFEIPVCHAMGEALLLGAQTVNPDAELFSTAVGDWYDISKAKEAALAQADAGVDYWIACGQGPTFGTIEAAKEKGGYATGYVGDMTETGPEVILTNVMWNLEPLYRDVINEYRAGTFEGSFLRYGMDLGGLDIMINPGLADQIPAEAMADMEAAREQIKSGEFEVPFIPE